jgi:hypothetical protein
VGQIEGKRITLAYPEIALAQPKGANLPPWANTSANQSMPPIIPLSERN